MYNCVKYRLRGYLSAYDVDSIYEDGQGVIDVIQNRKAITQEKWEPLVARLIEDFPHFVARSRATGRDVVNDDCIPSIWIYGM